MVIERMSDGFWLIPVYLYDEFQEISNVHLKKKNEALDLYFTDSFKDSHQICISTFE